MTTTAAAPVEVDTELAALRAAAADVAASRATFLVQIHSLVGTCPTRWGIGDDQAIGEARELAQDPTVVGSTGTRARQYLAGLDALDARASDIQARIAHLELDHATTGNRTRPETCKGTPPDDSFRNPVVIAVDEAGRGSRRHAV